MKIGVKQSHIGSGSVITSGTYFTGKQQWNGAQVMLWIVVIGYLSNYWEAKRLINKKTIAEVLTKLGWQIKGRAKKPKKIKAPVFSELMQKRPYVSEILDKYDIQSFKENIRLPAYV